MNYIAAELLRVYTAAAEAAAYWVFEDMITNLFPADYFTRSMVGVRIDVEVVKHAMTFRCCEVSQHLEANQINIEMFCISWLVCAFSTCLPSASVTAVWDLLFIHGSGVL